MFFRKEELEEDNNEAEKKQSDYWSYTTKILLSVHCRSMDTGIS